MKQKNRIDERLMVYTVREGSYPDLDEEFNKNFDGMIGLDGKRFEPVTVSKWNESQSLKRNQNLSKRLLTDLNNGYKKVNKNWSDFWDLCLDFNPEYCFLCGRYVIPKMRADTERIKRPYKKGDIVHDYCFTKFMTVERTVAKLTPDAELICHLDLGWAINGSVCRERVNNNPKAIAEHLILLHGWNKIPELVAGEITEGRVTEKQWKKEVSENNKKWFYDCQLDYDVFRNEHFLKPNGRAFRSLA